MSTIEKHAQTWNAIYYTGLDWTSFTDYVLSTIFCFSFFSLSAFSSVRVVD